MSFIIFSIALTKPVVLRLLLGLLASLLTIHAIVSKHDELLFFVGDARGDNEEVVVLAGQLMTRSDNKDKRKRLE